MLWRCCETSGRRRLHVQYPDNGAYMVAAYIIVAVVVLLYGISLAVRIKKER